MGIGHGTDFHNEKKQTYCTVCSKHDNSKWYHKCEKENLLSNKEQNNLGKKYDPLTLKTKIYFIDMAVVFA